MIGTLEISGSDAIKQQKTHHRRLGVEHAFIHVDIDDLRAVFDLLARDRQRIVVAAFENHLGKRARAGHVGAFTDVDEQRVLADVERLQPGQAHRRFQHRRYPRGDAFDRFRNRCDVRGRGAAAATDDVQESRARPFANVHGHFRAVHVVFAKRVGQAGVGVGRNKYVGLGRQFSDVLAQQIRAERAVEADRQRLGVTHRVPERFAGLARKRAAGSVGDGAGNHHRQPQIVQLEVFLNGKQRGLRVERVENRLDHQDVGAALDQAVDGFQIRHAQLVERHVAESRVVDVGRNRRGARSRAEHAGDEARLVRIQRGRLVGSLTRQPGGGEVELRHQEFHVVIRHRNRGGVEAVGFQNIRARRQILGVDFLDDVRLCQAQQVVVAFQVVREVGKARAAIVGFVELVRLDHRPHRAVKHEDTLGKQGIQQGKTGHGR